MNDIKEMFYNSTLHDYKMEKIEIDYPNGIIILQFLDCKNVSKEIVIRRFISIEFINRKEWGEGTYVVSSDFIEKESICDIEFQLNSGDFCKIKYCP